MVKVVTYVDVDPRQVTGKGQRFLKSENSETVYIRSFTFYSRWFNCYNPSQLKRVIYLISVTVGIN